MDVVALGELLIDFTECAVDKDGYPTLGAHPGGAPANFLAPLAAYGKKCSLIAKVGEDSFGRLLVSTLKKAKIGTEGIVTTADAFTTLAFVTLSEGGERDFSFARKPGADTTLSSEEMNLDLIENTKIFHFGTLSLTNEPARSATEKAVLFAKEKGKVISFDPNLRPPLWSDLQKAKEAMLWGLEKADVVKISQEEVEFLFSLSPEKALDHILSEFKVKLVFVTCGKDGAYFANKKAKGFVPALQGLHSVDATGAGDIFGGSAAAVLLETGKAPDELEEAELLSIVRFASAAAGLSTEIYGGLNSVPARTDVDEKIKTQY